MIDLRSLSPYDWERDRSSVEKTSRAMVAHEDSLSWGYGAEMPPALPMSCSTGSTLRCGASGRWIPGWLTTRPGAAILPQVDDLAREAERVLAY